MPKPFNGQIHVRVPSGVHEEIAREAFERGTSISGIFAQALIVRRALRNIDPWKSISEVHRPTAPSPGRKSSVRSRKP